MANVFKGMSQTNFLDGLALKSGLNGHALFDYLCRLIDADNKTQEKRDDFETYPARTDEVIEFTGDRRQFCGYCYGRGVRDAYNWTMGIDIESWMYALAKTTGAKRIILHYVGIRKNNITGEKERCVIRELDTTYHDGTNTLS